MGTGDYICVTLCGGAPWGFTLREGEGDTYRPFIVSQVCIYFSIYASQGSEICDEVVSVNGEPCADLTLLQAFDLIDTSIDCLQLLLKRYHSISSEDYESEGTYSDERASAGEASESTTLHIFSPTHRSEIPRELYISESQDEAYCVELDSDIKVPEGPQLLCTELHISSSDDRSGQEPIFKTNEDKVQRCFSSGEMVELQVSMSLQTLDDVGCTSLGSARGFEGEVSNREAVETINTTITASHYVPSSVREPLSQYGVVSSPSMQGQVEVIFQQQQQPAAASGAGRGILSMGGPRVSESVGSQSEGEEGGRGHCEGVPGSFSVSFEIPPEDATAANEQDSDSEGDQDKPNKHRARHARLRRSESLSEKQVKEAKSKCKRIALLLTAAPPNPNNKGVLMFKKHRQRVKKYTLVSYGTGEDEPKSSDEEGEDNGDDKQETSTVEFTFVAPTDSEIDKHFLTNANSSKGVLTLSWDKGLLEIERNLRNQTGMECLPETKGKGALMFAQRRQRMDEISAEHDELRRQGMPVEGVQEVEKKVMEHSYMHKNIIKSNSKCSTIQQTSMAHNRTAKPFTAENMVATPYSHAMSGTNQESVGQGEQIASRDERISTPAIRTGILLDTRRKTTGKPMFTFKDAPKVSPNPALLNLLNRSDKKLGFESGPEEDYLSLGAEACNFLQSQRVKHKTPPPVAPKPQAPVNVSMSTVNTRPSPKPWLQPQSAPQSRTPPSPPHRMHSFTIGQRASSPINPMATVLNPSSQGSAFEMPAVRGKGADMFAKRQSRMEKFVVDSQTVEANKAVRSTSPAASLPNEWKYTPNVRAPPPRAYNPIQSPSYPPAATKQPPSSSPSTKAKKKDKAKPAPAPKPLNVIDVMKHQPYQLNSSLFIFGPGAEAVKPASPKPSCSPPNPPVDNQPVTYEQMAPVQPAGPFGPQPASSYIAPSFPVGARAESTSGGNTATAPKPKFTAKKSSAQVWKPTAIGRSYSFSPPARVPFTCQKSASASSSPRPLARAPVPPQARQTSWMEKGHKPPTPWEAASRHPLGLVDEAFAFQNLQQTLASKVRLAAQRKMLPEPPAEWKAGVPYRGPQKTGSQTWSQSQSRSQTGAPLPSFLSPTRSPVSTPVSHAGYRSLPRQWQPQKPVIHANPRPSVSLPECQRPLGRQNYKSVYTSNTWSWRR
uniref:Synaptopodin 2 n=1 Tax=Amphiprion percula TaxID=161767 RepID=A0A3P8U0Q6_AMPPE